MIKKRRILPRRHKINIEEFRVEIINKLLEDPTKSKDPNKLICKITLGIASIATYEITPYQDGKIQVDSVIGSLSEAPRSAAILFACNYFKKNPPKLARLL